MSKEKPIEFKHNKYTGTCIKNGIEVEGQLFEMKYQSFILTGCISATDTETEYEIDHTYEVIPESVKLVDKFLIPDEVNTKEEFHEYMKIIGKEFTFGDALIYLKRGAKIARKGWNGKGMFIYLVEQSKPVISELRGACEKHVLPTISDLTTCYDECITIGAHIDMKAADGSVAVGWFASQIDMLAEDWVIV